MKTPLEILARKIHSKRRLFYASLELTYACNFACRFCYNPVERIGQGRGNKLPPPAEEPALKFDEIVSLMKKLRDGGVMYFTLTGGEPMVHPRFWDIAEAAKEQAFALRVFTNGSLIDEEAARRFGVIMPNCVELSIYGASESSYEESCGRRGAFSKVVEAIDLLKRNNVTVYLKCMLTRATEKEMDQIQDIADRSGCPLNWDPVLQRSDDGLDYPLLMSPGRDSVVRLLSDPGRFRTGRSVFEGGDGEGVCNIGRNLLHIDPYGNIYPCIEWKESIGNVRRDDILEIWENHPKLKDLMRLSIEMASSSGSFPEHCRYCMGQSMKKYSDPKMIDKDEIEVARIRNRIEKSRGDGSGNRN